MRTLYAVKLLVASTVTSAQPLLPTFDPSDTITIQCPQDTSVHILTYQGWEAYQTTDDTWWGPRDTTACIDLAYVIGNWVYPRIAVDQIDATRPVFLRTRYDDANVLPLTTNDQYAIGFQAYGSSQFDAGPCPGGPCTGLFAGVRIPDALGTGTDMRWYQAPYDDQGFSQYQLQVCVPTEKFTQNDLREFVVSFKLVNPQPGTFMEYFYSEVQDMDIWGSLVRLTSTNLPNYQWGQFSYGFGWGWENFLVMHDNTEYPDADHEFYLDFPAVPNVATPTEVTVNLQPYCGFNFQPYTQLRGGLVLGSADVRHPLTVVNQGADLCMGWEFIEVVWPGGSQYIHEQGHISFEGKNACFQFQPGSTLRVADESTFQYGYNGRGLLLLIEGSQLIIGRDAELLINGSLIIKEPPAVTEHRDMHITLGPGARLRFAPGSRLRNEWSNQGLMKLVVTLDGGSLDLTGLSPADREKVVVIELPKETWSDIRILGNPANEALGLSFSVRETGMVSMRAMDAMGKLLIDTRTTVSIGENRIQLPIQNLHAGHYVLEMTLGGERRTIRFVKD